MIYSVLTPPPGFDALRRLQANLERSGRSLALALPPLVVLGEGEAEPRWVPLEAVWTPGKNGWKIGGEANQRHDSPMPRLLAETGWLLLPWDDGPLPESPIPGPLPLRKLTWGLLEIHSEVAGIRWRWLKQRAFLAEV